MKKRQPSGAGKGKKKPKGGGDVEIVDGLVIGEDEGGRSGLSANSAGYHPTPLPKPPAGFVVDDQGRVVMASNKRLVTIVSSDSDVFRLFGVVGRSVILSVVLCNLGFCFQTSLVRTHSWCFSGFCCISVCANAEFYSRVV